jgi:hypothetical protein
MARSSEWRARAVVRPSDLITRSSVAPFLLQVRTLGVLDSGPRDVAVAIFTFPDDERYRHYRQMFAIDPECQGLRSSPETPAALATTSVFNLT